MARTGTIERGAALGNHVRAVTQPGGARIQWNQLAEGIGLLDEGQEIEYLGLAGFIEFDLSGQTPSASTRWWTIGPGGFADLEQQSDCAASL